MADDSHLTKKAKTLKRVKKQQQILEAEKYHHETSRKDLAKTKVAGGYAEASGEGLNEGLHAKMSEKLQNLRAGLHVSRERARSRGRKVFAAR